MAIDQKIRNTIAAILLPPSPNAAEPTPFDIPVRWTVKRLLAWVAEALGRPFCRETVRKVLRHLGFTWKKAKNIACPCRSEKMSGVLGSDQRPKIDLSPLSPYSPDSCPLKLYGVGFERMSRTNSATKPSRNSLTT
ncbi:MAG: winged helix-turn-helix domain-containing protein [Magnetococcales bacterium]|nr:winged helix-turn-helix domain-containing protein [Magnetococcales bacterium]